MHLDDQSMAAHAGLEASAMHFFISAASSSHTGQPSERIASTTRSFCSAERGSARYMPILLHACCAAPRSSRRSHTALYACGWHWPVIASIEPRHLSSGSSDLMISLAVNGGDAGGATGAAAEPRGGGGGSAGTGTSFHWNAGLSLHIGSA